MTPQLQAALYYNRRRNRQRAAVQVLAPWESGKSITAGEYRQSFGNAYQATTAGTTGSTAPAGVNASVVDDGGVHWIYAFPSAVGET